jgi:hypothetical protein
LLKILFKMSDSLHMLRCPSLSYFARYTVILVTSRDCSHITWSRNPASVSLLAIENIKMIFLFEITRLKNSFEYQIWRKKMKNQLIFMNLWHYVEIENVEQFELIDSIAIISILIVFVILKKFRKIKINNFKIVMIMKNWLKNNNKNLLKNKINAKNVSKIFEELVQFVWIKNVKQFVD